MDARERLVVVYGRRRLGKSRLLLEALADRTAVYWVADQRDAALQRASLARELARRLPGFDAVVYPDWDSLFDRLFSDAPSGFVVAMDELPDLVRASPEIPSLLQKRLDRAPSGLTLALCGSSQTMMHGLVLDGSAPLFGRASEILQLRPLGADWLAAAFGGPDPVTLVERWAVFGGVPRYWELARAYEPWAAIRELVLDPLGPLHREPERLLRDEVSETGRAESILALVGQGCHRISEIGARLGVPANDLSRPLARLVSLGLVARQVPFGRTLRDTKRTLYVVADPFLRFWYRFVDPNRSRLEARQVARVMDEVRAGWRPFLGQAWEDLARQSVSGLTLGGRRFGVAGRMWGATPTGPVEIDVVADIDRAPERLLVAEAKLSVTAGEVPRLIADLHERARRCVDLARGREIDPVLFVLEVPHDLHGDPRVVGPEAVLRAFSLCDT
jgi:AAA+ ATPase superfamily predicted ATPase